MGIILCKHHGKTGISLCCEHLNNSINNKSIVASIIKIQIDVLDDSTELLPHYICGYCAKEYGFSNYQILPGDYFGCKDDNLFPVTVPVCGSCLKTLMIIET